MYKLSQLRIAALAAVLIGTLPSGPKRNCHHQKILSNGPNLTFGADQLSGISSAVA